MVKCEICNRDFGPNDIRLDVCWDCAEAEGIIFEGLDMYDLGPRRVKNEAAQTAMAKVEFLITKGWTPPGGK